MDLSEDLSINEEIRSYKDRLRIFLILYFFSEPYSDSEFPSRKKIFRTEVRIQKLDFLLRNPDYLAYELLLLAESDEKQKNEIQTHVKSIFDNKEPIFKRLEMERFFFGAYEDIDDVIGFLIGIGFIDYKSETTVSLKSVEKEYFITDYAIDKVESLLQSLSQLTWYVNRCKLIRNYFGNKTGNELKVAQYKISEYRDTSYKDYITEISSKVKEKYEQLFNLEL
ncbi:hypothetical protein [Xanthocytophaga agilis]|uniref:Uncharacterized protein n=1 Tax=Xanthocytophaga agilis TaxID=3048010 RepID=A0AAE3R8G3_9BACT|nr:hypothetical protein [Xanthocytophaga agilis]MDJ1503502.1 hypothetical protein [Xanthocytophaga agilis]